MFILILYFIVSILLIHQVVSFKRVHFGAFFQAIDFSTEYSLYDDNRVHELHKITYPDICRNYVLWRVTHDGSCWNSVGITLLIYEMIEGGEVIFDHVIDNFKNILARVELNVSQQKLFKDFFAIFDLMRRRMDHRFSLELRNHNNIYKTLDQGFRILIASQERQQERPDYLYADEIELSKTRGHMSNIRPLLSALGFSYAGIDCFNKDGEIEVIKASLEEYLDCEDESLLRKSNFGHNKNIIDKMPVILALGSKPNFADVAVKRCFAEAIKNAEPKESVFSRILRFCPLRIRTVVSA